MLYSTDAIVMFIEAATLGSFSAAARKLGRQQSTVSEAIANLEIDLGISLFDRSTRKPTLTQQGQVLLVHAQQMRDANDRLSRAARQLAGGLEPQLCFALSDTYQSDVFEKTLVQLEQRYPSLHLECLIAEDLDAVELVQSGRVQMALVAAQTEYPADIGYQSIAEQSEIGLYVSPQHPLASMSNISDISDSMLRDYRELRLNTYREEHRTPIQGLHWSSSSYLILLEMTEQGFGWAALPRWIVKRFGAADLKQLAVRGWPRTIQVHLIWSRQRGLGQAGSWLCEQLLQPVR
ncbi:DNA-binding transcriptional LysR family regulator [Herbaspirillum sp. Sphag1AN]|uniref:LysR family transcriptional regulator n=1 Tax=unclassified Herbaspirillum TaxID=2624150 RepID=UPI00161AA8D1|nr:MULTISPECIES: LysR family transcriptional regulator [unclassified Herbaspirillum]MBB3211205.1 DNA-binding transcriptional LysR family regulator [Herbaspirillum sp. Sphag1AN]MBB3244834.1 DNA-binding transcriptional LysR family regulator [Herbaspirillum sp. Sphag64]